ncbi:hypothetical protein AVEN_27939-1 [Araneus ventricosus]|uniref:Uncharacterized protein n=1 Tax=Araneus ventricosus TaxID=182803 RepID=A0A4Y2IL50_ARAVE|nr:hypothetical protein AVEN_27939-1 [Araneus ventricosus]
MIVESRVLTPLLSEVSARERVRSRPLFMGQLRAYEYEVTFYELKHGNGNLCGCKRSLPGDKALSLGSFVGGNLSGMLSTRPSFSRLCSVLF